MDGSGVGRGCGALMMHVISKGHAEPLYLVSNMSSAEEAIEYYTKRFRIETFFSDSLPDTFITHFDIDM